ncbi:CDP-glucose 4,6-dehydratase [Mariprofundus ferrinatatus]|uniref:CDP-glucose 4,6-dehydratase n=1 Tax=Mariprofundus ferrinatatus TaxID=1921087 RepID=A0A2K8LFD0_9PROT|nr:CDP-glucose 4,6-dehydratase [Mariprofundus ferrinatatus]ATX82976.1 CDP-glucose 4,6-dehydratase [Mariprofundus ferrinatatus]
MVTAVSFGDIYQGKRVLITGHTGFKGSWLSVWLNRLGAKVAGIGLDPDTDPEHWQFCQALLDGEIEDHRIDIADIEAVRRIVGAFEPEVVFHLAAQPLVRRSYNMPVETWTTNVIGTVNVLEVCRSVPGLKAIVVVTSDKCYDNRSLDRGYNEEDALGGHDPYSASKAATELVASSYRRSFFSEAEAPLLATARAGNVIGGGDWSEDRLIPDLYRAVAAGSELEIRSPDATRPWQHVLDALSGYLLLGQRLLLGERGCAAAWNFGPDSTGTCSVRELLSRMQVYWPGFSWHVGQEVQLHEAVILQLDIGKAVRELQWQPVWALEQAIANTAEWYSAYLENGEVLSAKQLDTFLDDAHAKGAVWI